MLSLIVATGQNNEIGKNHTMPWHLPEDLKYFKEKTNSAVIIMGRKTFESLPKVLPNRKHIVITTDENYKVDNEMVEVKHSLEEVVNTYAHSLEEAFIIGGAQIYKQAINYCKKLYITLIYENFEADTYFPKINKNNFVEVYSSEIMISKNKNLKYQFKVYNRRH